MVVPRPMVLKRLVNNNTQKLLTGAFLFTKGATSLKRESGSRITRISRISTGQTPGFLTNIFPKVQSKDSSQALNDVPGEDFRSAQAENSCP
jgi:hypothetical protein